MFQIWAYLCGVWRGVLQFFNFKVLRPSPVPIPSTPLSGPSVLTNGNSSGNGPLKIQRGPDGAVELPYEVKEHLKKFYVAEDFKRIAQLFISYSLNGAKKSMVNELFLLLKTLPVPSPGKFITYLFVNIVMQNGSGKPIPQHLRDALLSLTLSVLNLLYLNEANKFQEGFTIIVAVEVFQLNVFDYLENKFFRPGVLLFAARCCYEMQDMCMALRYLTCFHKAVKDRIVEDELIKLEADISFDVVMCMSRCNKEKQDEIEEREITQIKEDLAHFYHIIECLEDYQNACESNRTRFDRIKSTRG